MPMTASTPSLQTRRIGTRSLQSPTMLRTAKSPGRHHRRLPRRSHCCRHHSLAPAGRSAHRRASAALLHQHPFHVKPRDADTADARAPQDAIDELRRSGELRRIADLYALPVLINQTFDTQWFRILAFIGIVAFALSGVVLAYEGQYTLFGALVLAALPAVGGGIVRDLLLQRDPLGVVQNPEALVTVFGTVLAGM